MARKHWCPSPEWGTVPAIPATSRPGGIDRMHDYDSTGDGHHHSQIHSHVPGEPALRVKALESLLVEKGLLDSAAVDAWVEAYRDQIGPKIGAWVVARA